MHQSIHWEQEFSYHLPKSIISETSDINIPTSNIVPQMLPKNNYHVQLSKPKIVIKRKGIGIPLVKGVSDVVVNVPPICLKSRIKMEVV